jgi:hypothetical protein
MASAVAAARIVQHSFAQGLSEANGLAARCMRIVPSAGTGDFRCGNGAFGGIGATLSGTATSVSNSDYFTYETTQSMVKKVIKHTVPVHTVKNDTGFEQAGLQLAASAIATMDKGGFDGLEGLFALAHPRVGGGAGQVGGGKMYLDTGLAYLQGEGGGGTHDNLLTSALDEAALNSAIELLLTQRSDRGVPLHIGASGGLVLVVDPKNAKTAHELVRSQLSGADMASNFVNGLISDIVVYPLTTDNDDWFLIAKNVAPVGIAIGSDPTARISMTTDGLFYELVAEVEYTFFKSPYEYGIVGSDVA